MAGKLSAYARQKLLDHFFKTASFTVPTNIYVALSYADPLDDGSGIDEPTTASYARTQCNTWDAAASASNVTRSANTSAVTFPAATANYAADVTHYALFDASVGGNMLAYGSFSSPVTILNTETPEFDAGDFDIAFSGAFSDAIHEDLMDHLLKTTSMSQPANIYVALSTANPGAAGASIAEPSGGAYARQQCNTWDAAASSAGTSNVTNTNALTYPTATANWGTITWTALYSASSGGTFYGRAQMIPSQTVDDGEIITIPADALIWSAT